MTSDMGEVGWETMMVMVVVEVRQGTGRDAQRELGEKKKREMKYSVFYYYRHHYLGMYTTKRVGNGLEDVPSLSRPDVGFHSGRGLACGGPPNALCRLRGNQVDRVAVSFQSPAAPRSSPGTN